MQRLPKRSSEDKGLRLCAHRSVYLGKWDICAREGRVNILPLRDAAKDQAFVQKQTPPTPR
jgi:hypothetical protein